MPQSLEDRVRQLEEIGGNKRHQRIEELLFEITRSHTEFQAKTLDILSNLAKEGSSSGIGKRSRSQDEFVDEAPGQGAEQRVAAPSPRKRQRQQAEPPIASSSVVTLKQLDRIPESDSSQEVEIVPQQLAQYLTDKSLIYHFAHIPKPVYVSRELMYREYGVSRKKFWATISCPIKRMHKLRHLAFPTLAHNPFMPCSFGLPGLIFGASSLIDPDYYEVRFSLFVKSSSELQWRYLGEYRQDPTVDDNLATENFRMQEDEVQEAWGHRIFVTRSKSNSLGLMRGRIQSGVKGEAFSGQDCVNALRDGTEKLKVIRIICVGYDEEFAAHLLRSSQLGHGAKSR